MFLARYKHFVSSGRGIASRLLAITIALSLFAMWAPIASVSADDSGVMACCIGKDADHCDSGLTGHKPPSPPEPEPMCGMTPAKPDAITTVAERSTEADVESNATVEPVSLSKPCPMDCGACTAGTLTAQSRRSKDSGWLCSWEYRGPPSLLRFSRPDWELSTNASVWRRSSVPRGPPFFLSI